MGDNNPPADVEAISARLPAVCRTCLTDESDPEFELYQIEEIFLEEDEITTQVHSFVEVLSLFVNDDIGKQDDRLPKTICLACVEKARAAFQFIEMCRVTDSLLEQCLTKQELDSKPLAGVDHHADLTDQTDHEADDEAYEQEEVPESIKMDGLIEYTDQSTKEKFTLLCIEEKSSEERSKSKEKKCSLSKVVKASSPSKEGLPKRHECDICHKTFTQPQTLTRHKKIHYKDSEPGKPCTYCNRTFLRSDDLRRHIRTHTNERPYQCDQCPRAYKQSFELKEHQKASHPEDGSRQTMKCTICSKHYSTRNGLYVHMKIHRGERNHGCSFCGKRFVTSGELTSHLKHIHTKEVNVKLLACGIGECTRKFVTRAALRTHHARKHAAEMTKVEQNSD